MLVLGKLLIVGLLVLQVLLVIHFVLVHGHKILTPDWILLILMLVDRSSFSGFLLLRRVLKSLGETGTDERPHQEGLSFSHLIFRELSLLVIGHEAWIFGGFFHQLTKGIV